MGKDYIRQPPTSEEGRRQSGVAFTGGYTPIVTYIGICQPLTLELFGIDVSPLIARTEGRSAARGVPNPYFYRVKTFFLKAPNRLITQDRKGATKE